MAAAARRARDAEPADALPVELDSLEKWAVADRILRELLDGLSPAECMELERNRGDLPPGRLSDDLLREIGHQVDHLLLAPTIEREQPPETHDVDVPLADGSRLVGTVRDVRGDVVFSLTYSRLGPKHRLLAWIDLVALTVAHPDRTWKAVAVGRGRGKGAVRSVFDPLPHNEAVDALEELVALYRAGLRSPLPVPLKTAAAYFERRFGRLARRLWGRLLDAEITVQT